MTKSQAFQHADPVVVAQMYATNASPVTLAPLQRFVKRKNILTRPVIAMMIMYIISADSEQKPKGQLPARESYYRIVQEEWISMELLTPDAVLSYFKDAFEHVRSDAPVSTVKPMNTVPKRKIDPALDSALDSIYSSIR